MRYFVFISSLSSIVFMLFFTSSLQGIQSAKLIQQEQQISINTQSFCQNLQNSFIKYATGQGYSQIQAAMLASNAATVLIAEIKSGTDSQYINAQALAKLANIPTTGNEGYLPVANFLKQALRLDRHTLFTSDVNELKYVPFANENTDLLVVTNNIKELTPKRAQMVAKAAKSSNIRLSFVWIGETPETDENANQATSLLSTVARATTGKFVDLSGQDIACDAIN